MPRIYCFAPVEDVAAKVLILGSIPGAASLAAGEYYAHRRNVFWKIMAELIGACSDSYEDRLNILRSSGIALWDVLGSCVRKNGSLDSHIEASSAIPNDFKTFFRQHPDIARVFFNGAKAEQCFLKYVRPALETTILPEFRRLPSTSPANAGVTYQQKLAAWRSVTQ